jgi:4'-phosphopantetheinyl transferase
MCASVRECPASGKSDDSGVDALYRDVEHVDMPIAGVDVWLARLDLSNNHIQNCAKLLSHEEHLRARRFIVERVRKRYIAGRALLRILLARFLDGSPQALCFESGSFGKPALAGEAASVHFNLSHAEEMAVVAISRTYELGIDVESLRRKLDHGALARHFFSAAENAEFQLLPEAQRKPAFLHTWTCKEAVAKALGQGLRARFVDIGISGATGTRPQLLAVPTHDIANWHLHRVHAGPDYVSTIAMRRRET